MRVLVLDFSTQVRESFITTLLPAGFEVIAIKEKKELIPTIAKMPFDIAVLEVVESDKEIIQMIRMLRADPRFANIKIIVHINSPSKQFIIDMIKAGVAGYLIKPFAEKGLLTRFQNILTKANIEMKERRHVRVKPDPKDNIIVTFRSPTTHKVISGKVLDISAGGVAFSLFGAVTDEDLAVRQFVNNFQIQIERVRATTPALIIAKQEKICAVQYYKIQDFDLNIICKYVYDRLSKDIDNAGKPVEAAAPAPDADESAADAPENKDEA
ncbi:MAG: response regulator [Spirochaetes bacterium]|nr:response regulator [Spirochaetota bacterium]